MSTKRGRKCSIKTCDNFQHTHKHLSFFRFPKDIERCRIWIEKTQRFDLLSKTNVHDERICQQHFEPEMFLNESQNRLQQYAIPTLFLASKPPPIVMLPTMESINLKMNDLLAYENAFNNAQFDMGMINAAAALLHQNNLTITPVYSSKSKPIEPMLKLNARQSITEPLNLSSSSESGSHSPNDSIILNDFHNSNEPAIISNHKQLDVGMMPVSGGNYSLTTNQIPNSINGTKPLNPINAGGFKRPRQIFTMEQENELADYVRDTSNYYSGLSSKEVRILAFVYGVCNQVEMPPGWRESHQASFDWIVGFIKRTKLPPTMITGISVKGSTKHKTASTEPKPNNTVNQSNGHSQLQRHNIVNATPIEID